MIKRRFYRYEHGSRDAPSESSSSSSSDSEVEPQATDETEEEEDDDDEEEQEVNEEEKAVSGLREKGEASSSSGYESEDSSVNEVNLDSSGLPTSDDDMAVQNGGENIIGSFPSSMENTILAKDQDSPEKDETSIDVAGCVLKCKSVFKCRLCPRIVCLSEETIKAHLSSKRHARSEKLHKEGRLKLMLNSDGKLEGDIDPEDTTPFPGQKSTERKKKGKGRLKQKRSRQDTRGKARPSTHKQEKRRKNYDS